MNERIRERMDEKVVIITGASSGMGASTAKILAESGMKVMLAARREDRLEALCDEIAQNGGVAAYKVTNVASLQDMQELAEATIEQFGQIDVLINCAGIMPAALMSKLRVDDWNNMIDINLRGVLNGFAAVYPHMQERNSGHIINFGSVGGLEPTPTVAVYGATKAAVRMISLAFKKEQKPEDRVKVTVVNPGRVRTELLDSITDQETKDLFATLKDTMHIAPEDVARTIQFVIDQPEYVEISEITVKPTIE